MIYQQIEYRASLGRNEWVILICYPDKANGKATVSKFAERRGRRCRPSQIDNWLKKQA
jgi:hypothetical protein